MDATDGKNSDARNRTPGYRVRDDNVSHYTTSEDVGELSLGPIYRLPDVIVYRNLRVSQVYSATTL